jgi:acyl carrier protein
MKTQEQVCSWLIRYVSNLTAIRAEQIDTTLPFSSYGLDSTGSAGLCGDLSKWLGVTLSNSVVYDYPTVDELSAHALQQLEAQG